jgi:hypothetical protein
MAAGDPVPGRHPEKELAMERINKSTEVRHEGVDAIEHDGNETGARDVRRLAELELMLVGGGDNTGDWGG